MKDIFKKTIIWTNTEPPRNYLWARDNKVCEYRGGWVESRLFNGCFVPVDRIGLNKTKLKLKVGKTANLTAIVEPDNTTDKTVTWISSDPEVAQVSASGRVTAKSEGVATVFTAIGGKFTSCEIIVS